MNERLTRFVDVILPLSLPNLYTYRVPFELNENVKVGQRVVVQFGKSKLYAALVKKIHSMPPQQYEAKYIQSILDYNPVVTEQQLQFWDWMSSYYMCNIGDVMNAALPSGLKLSSETKIILNPKLLQEDGSRTINYDELTDKEFLLVEALELQELITLEEAMQVLDQKVVYPVVKSLLAKKVILVQEELKERYKPRMQAFVKLNEEWKDEAKLNELLNKLEKKAGKQLDTMMAYLKLSGVHQKEKSGEWVKKNELTKIVENAESPIKALVKKNIFELQEIEVDRLLYTGPNSSTFKILNTEQQTGLDAIKEHYKTKDVVLLHGVTSSGKTELYIKLIEDTLKDGKQVLYLLPEIALTTQIISRLQNVFGDRVGVYHSRFNENERVEIWNKVLEDKPQEQIIKHQDASSELSHLPLKSTTIQIVLGARSSLFLPFSKLGLVIVDEEHDTSYKQYDPAPRYNARDSAIFLASVYKAKVLLGSATPSLESYFNALSGKYGLVELLQRHGGVQMPEICLVDIKQATKRKMMKSHFSPELLAAISLSLKNKEQVILFQNRRGFSPILECNTCAWVPQCKNCDVSLTYHKTGNQLRCHYCGYTISVPTQCGACGDTNIRTKGFGTEKVEEELGIYFPDARISRMDLDTTRAKYAYRQLIADFENENIDILVGTQMVTKGLDFGNVALVGILNADSMLNYPDFRSFERSYQLMAQVAGRAGRKNKRGKVIIQTYNPGHAIINNVVNNNYQAMYTAQLDDRRSFNYPPYFRLIELTLKFKDIDVLNEGAKVVAEKLYEQLGNRVLGPEFPLVARVRNEYLKTIMIKTERETSTAAVKKIINDVFINFKTQPVFKQVKLQIDVDPM